MLLINFMGAGSWACNPKVFFYELSFKLKGFVRKLAVVSRDDCVRIGGNGANTKPILRHTGIRFFLNTFFCNIIFLYI